MDDAFDTIDKHSASFKCRAADLAKQYGGGKTITVSEASKILHVSRGSVLRLIHNDVLIAFAPSGKSWRLFKAQVQDYLIRLQEEVIEFSAASPTKKAWYE